MTTESGRVKGSTYHDRDVLRWLKERGVRIERSVGWQIRAILRAAMDAEQRQANGGGDERR